MVDLGQIQKWIGEHPLLSLALTVGAFILWRLPEWLGQVWPILTKKTVPEWLAERRWPGMSATLYRVFNVVTTVVVLSLLVVIIYQQWGREERWKEPVLAPGDSVSESTPTRSFELALIVVLAGYSAYLHFLLIRVRKDLNLMQEQMTHYVLPRSLTPEQKMMVAEYLSKHEAHPVTMKVVARNEEARIYGTDLQQSLEKGGWPVADIIYDDRVREGLQIYVSEPFLDPKPKNPFDRLNPKKKLIDILREAFEHAGITVNATQEKVGEGITTTTIIISVGNRRRDKGMTSHSERPLIVISPIPPATGE